MASLSVLSLAGRDFGCSWQQGLAQEASLADEGRVPCEAALQFDKGKTEAVLPYKECSVEMTVTLQSHVNFRLILTKVCRPRQTPL